MEKTKPKENCPLVLQKISRSFAKENNNFSKRKHQLLKKKTATGPCFWHYCCSLSAHQSIQKNPELLNVFSFSKTTSQKENTT